MKACQRCPLAMDNGIFGHVCLNPERAVERIAVDMTGAINVAHDRETPEQRATREDAEQFEHDLAAAKIALAQSESIKPMLTFGDGSPWDASQARGTTLIPAARDELQARRDKAVADALAEPVVLEVGDSCIGRGFPTGVIVLATLDDLRDGRFVAWLEDEVSTRIEGGRLLVQIVEGT